MAPVLPLYQLMEGIGVIGESETHLVGQFVGKPDGPTLIAVGSLHGNEPSGRLAVERVARQLPLMEAKLHGRVFLVSGNVRALSLGQRFVDADLNRHWTRDNIRSNTPPPTGRLGEDKEQHELLALFRGILNSAEDEMYVLDLHSTSAGGVPFATVGDTLRNRRFALKLPVTILLGIEEQLEGTMLEFLNNEGAVTLGFEAGQHSSSDAIDNHEALIWLALAASELLSKKDVPAFERYHQTLSVATGRSRILEVRYRQPVSKEDGFEMRAGLKNFDPARRGELLAKNHDGPITAPETGLILMPLYQRQGEDGFFIVRTVARFWLRVSEFVRRLNLAAFVRFLPGVRAHPKHPETLQVDTNIARLFPLQIFHLLGFRRLRWHSNFLIVSRRRFDTSSPFNRKEQ